MFITGWCANLPELSNDQLAALSSASLWEFMLSMIALVLGTAGVLFCRWRRRK